MTAPSKNHSVCFPPMISRTKFTFLLLFIFGVSLMLCGTIASDSVVSDLVGFFKGAPTDKTIWFLIIGMSVTAIGASGLIHERNA